MEALNVLNSNIIAVQTSVGDIAGEMATFRKMSDRISRLESSHASDKDLDASKHTRNFQVPTQRLSSSHVSAPFQAPPPLRTVATDPLPSLGESPFPSKPSQRPPSDMAIDMADTVEEDDDGPPVNPGQPSIPVNHTTGWARLLINRAIKELAGGFIKTEKIRNENYPMLQEERRGLLRLFGRGEGTDRIPGYDKDPMLDANESNTPTPSDASSDTGSPGEDWGQLGGLTPPGNLLQQGHINHEGMPDFSPGMVKNLVDSYMTHMNIMHPILVPAKLNNLVEKFLRTIPDNAAKPKQIVQLTSHGHAQSGQSAVFVGSQNTRHPDSPSNKRKRPPGDGSEQPAIPDFKPGLPFRSIGTAIVLLVMALGEICLDKGKIKDCIPTHEGESTLGSPAVRNGHPSPSGLQSSPSTSTVSGLPSPVDAERVQPRSRRASVEGIYQPRNTSSARPKNLDVVPGLKYFAFATDILGNQAGGNSLQHVHANILASLYHGQLGRPLESHAYLHQACRSLQVILRP